jgi:hypothetical protein
MLRSVRPGSVAIPNSEDSLGFLSEVAQDASGAGISACSRPASVTLPHKAA